MSPKFQTIKGGHTKLEILFQIVNLKNYDEVYKGEMAHLILGLEEKK